MKRRIKHTCSHEETHTIVGTAEERETRFRWLKKVPCLACWSANRQLEARLDNTVHALPPLAGTPAQVDWAERIRAARVREVATLWFDARVADRTTDPVTRRLSMEEALAELGRATCAGWWIDRRDLDVVALLDVLARAAPGL